MSKVYYFNHKGSFIKHSIQLIKQESIKAIQSQGSFNVVLSGGESPKEVYCALRNIDTDWRAWHIWFADERCLPAGDKDLNSTLVQTELLDYVNIDHRKIHRIKGELGAAGAAAKYSKELAYVPSFDLTLLGIGEDGHTASLFPNQLLNNSSSTLEVVPVFNSPKYPSERVSLSLLKINSSKKILFLVTGEKKRTIVNSFLKGEFMPATLVKGRDKTSLFYCPQC
jgi:6-phosphogluconolactonase